MDTGALMEVLDEVVIKVRSSLDRLTDWGLAGTRSGQYRSDLVADEAALEVLSSAGIAVLSEESGRTGDPSADLLAVLDPVDGSTNASRGIPWFATSVCVLDAEGPLAALVVNQATSRRYEAVRAKGARRDGKEIRPSEVTELRKAVIGLSGYPRRHLGWRQYRALGAAALDLCAVADGTLDAFADCGQGGHGVWDYLGGLLVCKEAGAHLADAEGRDLVVLEHGERRIPVAGATEELLEALLDSRTESTRTDGGQQR